MEDDASEPNMEGEAPEPNLKKLKPVVEELENIIKRQDVLVRKDAPDAFINILKFLNIYELEKIYKMLSMDMRHWWIERNVWKSLCIMKMGQETFDEIISYISYILYDVRTHQTSEWNYKWVLIAWEFYSALRKVDYMVLIQKNPIGDFTSSGPLLRVKLFLKNEEVFIEASDEIEPYNTMFFMYLMGNIKADTSKLTGELGMPGRPKRVFTFSGKHIYYPYIYLVLKNEYYLKREDFRGRPDPAWIPYRAIRSCIVCGNEAKVMVKNDPNKIFCNKKCWEELK